MCIVKHTHAYMSDALLLRCLLLLMKDKSSECILILLECIASVVCHVEYIEIGYSGPIKSASYAIPTFYAWFFPVLAFGVRWDCMHFCLK